ncbi:DNA repair metallo-beta-lactamase-domain-containing protein [Xylariales sp. AK1849]|nr:DNA repair metallo-beta-lactamase-domain-containing protein [Xylariales sp. AK1849]
MPPTKTAKPRTPRQTKLSFQAATTGSDTKKKKQPANGNILNFFKKVEIEETLFIEEPAGPTKATPISKPIVKPEEEGDTNGAEDDYEPPRFNEDQSSSKRRKLSHDGANGTSLAGSNLSTGTPEPIPASKPSRQKKQKKTRKGPFLDDSDSENDSEHASPSRQQSRKDESPDHALPNAVVKTESSTERCLGLPTLPKDGNNSVVPEAPSLKQEDSVYENFRGLEETEGLFDDEELEDGGEEFRYMRYMQEQARLEAEEAGDFPDSMLEEPSVDDSITERCPLCDSSLAGITSDQATVHVNACLDGNPVPLPAPLKPPSAETVESPEVVKRFARAAVPRPGQINPITLGNTAPKGTSAFSKLMSGHAEDAAWASAAAAEHSSRGKPAYERTCPFYKIMPGLFICVDAFRYGAVKGCNAYFLSHFHSDHYIGLTARWSHGPIYCSKVTGSLVKQQLGTNAKWVKVLEFEERVEIPGTEGVTVTMIPANHCPGSSLFLFEKTTGKGPKVGPRTQRILHCGDFRACQAHVTHPLLKPDVVDAISGKTRQQKIDICYLDTTYMNPRYSFPPQEDVISACAEFCKTISGDPNATDDAYEALKREKGGASLSKFFTKEPSGDEADAKSAEDTRPNPKHRLLVICGTYSIGKERICKAIAQALNTKIFASPSKIKIIQQLGDPELSALLTSNPREAQVHMQMLMEIRAETLQEYLNTYKPHFSRIIGFRPSGWNFRNPTSTAKSVPANVSPSSVPMTLLLHGPAWKTRFGARDFVAQRGSTREAMCFGVPYSEHSSFRELALFTMALRIEKIVPTVNIGSEQSRKRMKGWLDRWMAERRRGGVVRVLEEDEVKKEDQGVETKAKGGEQGSLWEGKDGSGGGVYW